MQLFHPNLSKCCWLQNLILLVLCHKFFFRTDVCGKALTLKLLFWILKRKTKMGNVFFSSWRPSHSPSVSGSFQGNSGHRYFSGGGFVLWCIMHNAPKVFFDFSEVAVRWLPPTSLMCSGYSYDSSAHDWWTSEKRATLEGRFSHYHYSNLFYRYQQYVVSHNLWWEEI